MNEQELAHFGQEDCPICRSVREKRAEAAHFQIMANLTSDETRQAIEAVNDGLDQAQAEGWTRDQLANRSIEWFTLLKRLATGLTKLEQRGTPLWKRLTTVARRVAVEGMGLSDDERTEAYFNR